jgi:hypothetical protein
MKNQSFYRFNWVVPVVVLVFTIVSCSNRVSTPLSTDIVIPTSMPASIDEATSTPTTVPTASSPAIVPNTSLQPDEDVLYQDNFVDPSSGWPKETYDNYFIGYHEPDYYHVQVQSPNDKTLVPLPEKPQFEDVTIEVKLFTDRDNTATEGDYLYGLVFRRSGNQYYAFTISPSTQKWYVLKSSPSALEVLSEGTDENIQGIGLEAEDTLRVDARGSNFFFHINDRLVEQLSDPDYLTGEAAFYVQTFDNARIHAHFNSITIREVQPLQPQTSVLYQDNFVDPSSGWPKETYDNYFIGYHEPDYYHVQVQSPNDKTLVPLPEKPQFEDVTIEVKLFTDRDNTATEGDYLYGLVFRRSGNQYYAFTISPSTQKWYVLKSSPSALEVLSEGTDENIQGIGLEAEDTLRVDARGSNFFFHINDRLVEQLSDPDYLTGEAAFYVQTFDNARIHAHFNSITIREVQLPLTCSVTATRLYLRSGPGTTYSPITYLAQGGQLEPIGQSPDGEWILVRVDGSNQHGWVSDYANWVSCNIAVADLPIVEP